MYGAGSQENLEFHLTIYHLATQIPYGRVTTYGHLALLAGKPANSRQVGYALKHLSTNTDAVYNSTNVPWWRIINSSGGISNLQFRESHLTTLRREIPVSDAGRVNLNEYGWFPEDPDELNYDFRVPPANTA